MEQLFTFPNVCIFGSALIMLGFILRMMYQNHRNHKRAMKVIEQSREEIRRQQIESRINNIAEMPVPKVSQVNSLPATNSNAIQTKKNQDPLPYAPNPATKKNVTTVEKSKSYNSGAYSKSSSKKSDDDVFDTVDNVTSSLLHGALASSDNVCASSHSSSSCHDHGSSSSYSSSSSSYDSGSSYSSCDSGSSYSSCDSGGGW